MTLWPFCVLGSDFLSNWEKNVFISKKLDCLLAGFGRISSVMFLYVFEPRGTERTGWFHYSYSLQFWINTAQSYQKSQRSGPFIFASFPKSSWWTAFSYIYNQNWSSSYVNSVFLLLKALILHVSVRECCQSLTATWHLLVFCLNLLSRDNKTIKLETWWTEEQCVCVWLWNFRLASASSTSAPHSLGNGIFFGRNYTLCTSGFCNTFYRSGDWGKIVFLNP